MFAQQSLQPKLSRRRYAGVPYALQNNTVFRRVQNWVSDSDGSRTDNGSEFQSVGPGTAKHLWPYLIVLERGTARSPQVTLSLIKWALVVVVIIILMRPSVCPTVAFRQNPARDENGKGAMWCRTGWSCSGVGWGVRRRERVHAASCCMLGALFPKFGYKIGRIFLSFLRNKTA